MAKMLFKKISTPRFEEGLEQLEESAQKLRDHSERAKHRLLHRQQVTVGQLRDRNLARVYTVKHTLTQSAAKIFDRANDLSPLPLGPVAEQARRLQMQADALAQERQQLWAPDIDDYDALNVKKVNAQLDELNYYELEKLREYESRNKNRVTVLRAVERKLRMVS